MSLAEISPRDLPGHYKAVRTRLQGLPPRPPFGFKRPAQKPRPVPKRAAEPPPEPPEPYVAGVGTLVVAEIDICAPRQAIEFREPPPRPEEQPKLVDILRLVSEHFDVIPRLLVSACRERRFCRPRQIAMFLARQFTDRSYPYISERFGRRDHTTAISAVRRISHLCPRDANVAHHVALLEAELRRRFPNAEVRRG